MHPVVRLLLFRIEMAILSASDPSPFKSESTTLCSGNLIDPLLRYTSSILPLPKNPSWGGGICLVDRWGSLRPGQIEVLGKGRRKASSHLGE